MTIRLRLTVLFTVATLLVLAVGGVLYVKRLNLELEQGLNDTLSARADVVASELRGNGSNLNVRARLGAANGIYTQLVSVDGRLLTSTRALRGRPLVSAAEARSAAAGSLTLDTRVSLRGPRDRGSDSDLEPMRVLVVPSGRAGVVIAVAISRAVVDKAGIHGAYQLLIFGAIVLLLVAAGSWWITGAVLAPVERMRIRVAALTAEDSDARVPVPGSRDEISRLAVTFNALLARMHGVLARERAFVADVGHELRTPLSVLKGELELAGRPGRSPQELSATVAVAAGETDRLVRLTEDLLLLARDADSPRLRIGEFDLTELARVAAAAAGSRAAAAGNRLVLVTADPVWVAGDPDRIRQAIDNLISNALAYTTPGTTVTITTASDGGWAQLAVTDHGPGFPPQFLPVAFDRFTRAATTPGQQSTAGHDPGGSGLGLAIVQSVINAHHGTAVATNHPDGGATITLRWPATNNT